MFFKWINFVAVHWKRDSSSHGIHKEECKVEERGGEGSFELPAVPAIFTPIDHQAAIHFL